MFRLNGDIIKQLENIYGIKFFPKYKNELKTRILFFLNQKLREFVFDDILSSIKNMNEIILFVDNEPNMIRENFIKQYKEEIFNSFNPLWYEASKKPIEHVSKKEYNIQMNLIKLEIADKLDNLGLIDPEIFSFSSLEYLDSFRTYEKKELSYKMYLKIEKDLEKQFRRCEYNVLFNNLKHKIELFKSFMFEHTKEKKISYSELYQFCFKNDLLSISSTSYSATPERKISYYFFLTVLIYETLETIKSMNKNGLKQKFIFRCF